MRVKTMQVRFLQTTIDDTAIRIPLRDCSGELVFDHESRQIRLGRQILMRYENVRSVRDSSSQTDGDQRSRLSTAVTVSSRVGEDLVLSGECLVTLYHSSSDDAQWDLWSKNRDRLLRFVEDARRQEARSYARRAPRLECSYRRPASPGGPAASFGTQPCRCGRSLVAGVATVTACVVLYLLWRRR